MMSKPILDRMQSAVFELPCLYANRINVIVGDDGMARITFGEACGESEIAWNTAIAMTNANLEALYETIGGILQSAVNHGRPSKLS